MRFWIYLHLKCPSSTSLPARAPNLIHLTLWWDAEPELWILIASVQTEERLSGSQWCWKVTCSLYLITLESQCDPHFLYDYPLTSDLHRFQARNFAAFYLCRIHKAWKLIREISSVSLIYIRHITALKVTTLSQYSDWATTEKLRNRGSISPHSLDRHCGTPGVISRGARRIFRRDKAVQQWKWSFSSIYCRD